jgi:glycerophosphoryl diester phosphodiesterase
MSRIFSLTFILLLAISAFAQKQASPYSTQIGEGQLPQFLTYDGETLPLISAHRGGRYLAGYPENAIETFDYVLQYLPAIIECDVVMSSDSILYMMHDRSLDRTTTGTGLVKNKEWAYVQTLNLVDDFGKPTPFKVPTLDKVLQWTKGKAVITLDIKRGVPFEKVIRAIEKNEAADYIAVITYNFDDAQQVLSLNPNLMLSVSIRNMEEWNRFQASGIPAQNVIAFTGTRRSDSQLFETLHNAGILCIQGTMGNIDSQAKAKGSKVYQELINSGIDILATDRPLEAYESIKSLATKNAKRLQFQKR